MSGFDPYLWFRLGLFAVSTVWIVWDCWGLVVWYRDLPRMARRYILLLLLRARWHAVGREMLLVTLLTGVWLWLGYYSLVGMGA